MSFTHCPLEIGLEVCYFHELPLLVLLSLSFDSSREGSVIQENSKLFCCQDFCDRCLRPYLLSVRGENSDKGLGEVGCLVVTQNTT